MAALALASDNFVGATYTSPPYRWHAGMLVSYQRNQFEWSNKRSALCLNGRQCGKYGKYGEYGECG
jgi:hypothetical protein